MSDEDPDEDENSLLGDKTHIRKTLVRHIVASIMADVSDGRRFEQLDILELGAGDGFFVRSYAEVYAENGRGDLPNLVQTDANPQHSDVPRHADMPAPGTPEAQGSSLKGLTHLGYAQEPQSWSTLAARAPRPMASPPSRTRRRWSSSTSPSSPRCSPTSSPRGWAASGPSMRWSRSTS